MLHSIRIFLISTISFTLVFTTTLLNVDFETELAPLKLDFDLPIINTDNQPINNQ